MDFKAIFSEYFSLFRGQASNIPSYGDREFTQATYACNNAIRKWARADGVLWDELLTTAQAEASLVPPIAGTLTLTSGTLVYDGMANIRKAPSWVRFYNGTEHTDIRVSQVRDDSGITAGVYFTGGANKGFKLHVAADLTVQYDGWNIDYVYYKEPTLLPTTSDPSAVVIEMSDPNFAIQDMLSSRYANARNGFGYKTSQKDANNALINMKIENSSGTPGNSANIGLDTGWGKATPVGRIEL